MKILDRFIKRKSVQKKVIKKPRVKTEPKIFPEKIEKPKRVIKQVVAKKEHGGIAHKILAKPHVTEKTTNLETQGKYIFRVYFNANKQEIKKAIRDLYGVKVEKINIINVPRKPRKLGRSQGYKSGYKKAIITLEKGEKIEVISR